MYDSKKAIQKRTADLEMRPLWRNVHSLLRKKLINNPTLYPSRLDTKSIKPRNAFGGENNRQADERIDSANQDKTKWL